MKKITNWLFAAALISGTVFSMSSCSNHDELEEDICNLTQPITHRLTAEQAKQNALNFVNKLGTTTRANGKPLTVSDVKAIGIDKSVTRSEVDSVNLDSLFYVVNFDNNEGYVIASSDDRETPIFAYIEDGNYNEEDTLNNGYEAFMSSLIDTEIYNRQLTENDEKLQQSPTIPQEPIVTRFIRKEDDDEDNPYNGPTIAEDKYEVMLPLLKTKWDQSAPYNKYCPGPYTGCVVTAISQICSFLKSPNNVSWSYNGVGNSCNIDWDKIVKECTNSYWGAPTSYDTQDQVANLMRFWGVTFEAEYSSGGTSVNGDDAIDKLRWYGYNATKLGDYNATNVINDLKKGNSIIFMIGHARYYHVWLVVRKYVDGHAWVVDGYIDEVRSKKETIYLHCNWGWGGTRNGYFLSNVLNADESPAIEDNKVKTRSHNYRYNLKTSTICKKN